MVNKKFDIVLVPFPFTDIPYKKWRPALVLSSFKNFSQKSDHTVLAMITSAKHSSFPLDTVISDLDFAGLSSESIVRMKLFTIDNRLIVKRIGILSSKDMKSVKRNIFL